MKSLVSGALERLSAEQAQRPWSDVAAFSILEELGSDLLLPCSCGSRSVILSAHSLPNLGLGELNSMDTFKEKPCCVPKGRHIGELAAAERTCWGRLLDQGHRDAPELPQTAF